MSKKMDRRELMRKGGLLGLGTMVASSAAANECGLATPAQPEGPFYPIESQIDTDTDLTYVKNKETSAKGQRIRVKGRVLDLNCNPVPGALVEIWQACDSGKYNHPRDPNPAELDENFQYWGRTHTNAKGEYSFLTIRPGIYPATDSWVRPAHIHFKAMAPGQPTLTTQMYFADDRYNADDQILNSLTEKQREIVTVAFSAAEDSVQEGNFDIYLADTPELK